MYYIIIAIISALLTWNITRNLEQYRFLIYMKQFGDKFENYYNSTILNEQTIKMAKFVLTEMTKLVEKI